MYRVVWKSLYITFSTPLHQPKQSRRPLSLEGRKYRRHHSMGECQGHLRKSIMGWERSLWPSLENTICYRWGIVVFSDKPYSII